MSMGGPKKDRNFVRAHFDRPAVTNGQLRMPTAPQPQTSCPRTAVSITSAQNKISLTLKGRALNCSLSLQSHLPATGNQNP